MASPTGADLHTNAPMGVVPQTSGKLSQEAANYRPSSEGPGSCGACRSFRDGSCVLVSGRILASMTCDLFSPRTSQATESFRGVGGRLTRGRGAGGKRTHGQSYYTGKSAHGPSILNPAVYEALRDKKGMDKKSAAAISNAALSKKRKGGGWYKKGKHSSGKAVKMSEALTLQEFFDKVAYMKTYNARKRGPGQRKRKFSRARAYKASGKGNDLKGKGRMWSPQGSHVDHPSGGAFGRGRLSGRSRKVLEDYRKSIGYPPLGRKFSEEFSTPGRARALRALAAARRKNTARVARGEKPIVGGKKVSKIPGLTKKKAKARMKQPRKTTPTGKGPHGFVEFLAVTSPELLPEAFFDKRSYMKEYNARRHGAARAHKAQMKGGAMGGAAKALGGTKVRQNVNRVAKNRRQAGAKRARRAAAKAMVGSATRMKVLGRTVEKRAGGLNPGETHHYYVKGMGRARSLSAARQSIRAASGYSEDMNLQEFFDKKAYMASYNKRRWGSKKASIGRRRAVQGLGRINRSRKITKSNPSGASTRRIARLGMKRGSLAPGTSKTGMKRYVKGFVKARKAKLGLRQLAGPAGVGRVRAARTGAS